MKKNTLYQIAAAPLLALAVSAAACGNLAPAQTGAGQPNSAEAALPEGYALRRFTRSIHLAEKRTGSPRLNMDLTFLEIKKPERKAKFLRELLYSGNSAGQYQNALAGEYRDMYRQNPPRTIPGDSSLVDWEYRENLNIHGLGEHGVTLGREKDVYTGGAHGMRTKIYYVVDGEALTVLKLPDFFRDPQGAELRAFVMEELRRYSGLAEGQPLSEGIFFENEPEMSSNFFITENGLGLHWDPYDIAPYSEGSIEITLPWRTIRPLLKQEAIERLTKFGIYLFVS
ncbi:MAG: RsiV family protein [Treponema sp.]|jgi:hypothetical protein|nr:RsiV family protein [Treponema sp.]